MSKLREAAQQALEALRHVVRQAQENLVLTIHYGPVHDAMNRLEAALAEPVQEPLASSHINGTSDTKWHPPQRPAQPVQDAEMRRCPRCWEPMFPPQPTPLTEEQIDHAANNILTDDPVQWWRKLARAIERAHGIGGQP